MAGRPGRRRKTARSDHDPPPAQELCPVCPYQRTGGARSLTAVPGCAVGQLAVGALPVESVLLLVAGIAEALQSVRGARIVHRDLKPSNVLSAADGPRVIDFGIARAAEATVLTARGHVIGTPSYMSPEQATGGRVVDLEPTRTPAGGRSANLSAPSSGLLTSDGTVTRGRTGRFMAISRSMCARRRWLRRQGQGCPTAGSAGPRERSRRSCPA